MPDAFTPEAGAIGGALIALALAGMLVGNGRIAGLSGVCAGLVGKRGDRAWRVWFVAGMLAAGVVADLARPSTFEASARVPVGVVAVVSVNMHSDGIAITLFECSRVPVPAFS